MFGRCGCCATRKSLLDFLIDNKVSRFNDFSTPPTEGRRRLQSTDHREHRNGRIEIALQASLNTIGFYIHINMVLRKDELEASLHAEKKLIEDGRLKEDNPLDISESFHTLCEACRRGDLKACQEMIMEGANINARDQFDYTPLILVKILPASLSRLLR